MHCLNPVLTFIITIIFVAIANFVYSSSSSSWSNSKECVEPLLLMWYGPFQPTGGVGEDANSPLSFLHGLWYHINNVANESPQHPDFPPLDHFFTSSKKKQKSPSAFDQEFKYFSDVDDDDDDGDSDDDDDDRVDDRDGSFDKEQSDEEREVKLRFGSLPPDQQQIFSHQTQQYFAALLSNLTVSIEKRVGERQLVPGSGDGDSHRCSAPPLPHPPSSPKNVSSRHPRRVARVRLLGAANFAVNSRSREALLSATSSGGLPASHIAEYAAASRLGAGQSILTAPHNPENWLPLPADPSRIVVVCQSFSPLQWALPFPANADEYSGLCPPARSVGVKLRIGRIVPRVLSEKLTRKVNLRGPAGANRTGAFLDKDWILRMSQMDQIWVTSDVFKNALEKMVKEMNANKNHKKTISVNIKVIPEPIDTDLWTRSDTFFVEAYKHVFHSECSSNAFDNNNNNNSIELDPSWWRSKLRFFAGSIGNDADSDEGDHRRGRRQQEKLHFAKINRNLEILQRIGMIPPQWLLQQKMQSSPAHYLSLLNSTNLERRIVFAYPKQFANIRMGQDHQQHNQQRQLYYRNFFYDASEAPDTFAQFKDDTFRVLVNNFDEPLQSEDHRHGHHAQQQRQHMQQGNEIIPRIFTCVFSWSEVSGWDVTLRAFLEEFGSFYSFQKQQQQQKRTGRPFSSSLSAPPPVLILRTAGVTNDEFALDVPKTVELFVQMMYADTNGETDEGGGRGGRRSLWSVRLRQEEELFDQEKKSAKLQETEWMEELKEIQGGKLSAEQQKQGPKRKPVPDRPLALKLSRLQRSKMERELREDPGRFKRLCQEFCPLLPSFKSVDNKNNNDNNNDDEANREQKEVEDRCEKTCQEVASDSSAKKWRALMRRRLFGVSDSSTSASASSSPFSVSSSSSSSKTKKVVKTRQQRQHESELLITRPHILILLSSTSSSSSASHHQHSHSVGLDLEKYRVLLASSDVLIATGRGATNADGDFLRPIQEAGALGVPVMVTASSFSSSSSSSFMDSALSTNQLANQDRAFVVPFDEEKDRYFSAQDELLFASSSSSTSSSTSSREYTQSHKDVFWLEPNTCLVGDMMKKLSDHDQVSRADLLRKALLSRRFIVEKHDSIVVAKQVLDAIHEQLKQ